MAARDQFLCTDFIRAAIPATWGQDIEVPDRIAYPLRFSFLTGIYAARMSTPGTYSISKRLQNLDAVKFFDLTF